jgi:hypothetical protein
MMAMADKDGKLLEAGKLYKLDVPAEMPVAILGADRL